MVYLQGESEVEMCFRFVGISLRRTEEFSEHLWACEYILLHICFPVFTEAPDIGDRKRQEILKDVNKKPPHVEL